MNQSEVYVTVTIGTLLVNLGIFIGTFMALKSDLAENKKEQAALRASHGLLAERVSKIEGQLQ